MANQEAVVTKAGEVCADCPSANHLGKLSLGQTCEGPKRFSLGSESVAYCGRNPIKGVKQESLVEKLIRYSGMDE